MSIKQELGISDSQFYQLEIAAFFIFFLGTVLGSIITVSLLWLVN